MSGQRNTMHYVLNLHTRKTVGLNLHKKAETLLLLFLITLATPAFALSVTSLSAGSGNDWYTMGLGYNQDDGYSFGGYTSATFSNNLVLNAEAKAFTDRIQSNLRHDEVQINASYPFLFPVSSRIGISVVGSLGLLLSGNLGMQDIQNNFHSLIKRDPISLVYDEDSFIAHPLLAVRIQGGWLYGQSLLGMELGFSYIHRWEQNLQANVFLSYASLLTVRFGYLAKSIEGASSSQVVQKERYEGLRLSFTYDGGLLETSFYTFLQSGFSFGSFGINPLALSYPKTYQQTDFSFTSGILYNLEGHQNRLIVFSFGPISFETRHTNGPMLNYWENQNDRMNLGSWLLGYRFLFEREPSMFNPYTKVLAGLWRFNLQQDYTTTLVEEVRPSLGIEAGVRIGTQRWWVIGNTSYHPRLAVTLYYVFGTDSLRENPAIEYFEPHTGPWILMAGIVLDIDHDLT